jgi:hypothetical protein
MGEDGSNGIADTGWGAASLRLMKYKSSAGKHLHGMLAQLKQTVSLEISNAVHDSAKHSYTGLTTRLSNGET